MSETMEMLKFVILGAVVRRARLEHRKRKIGQKMVNLESEVRLERKVRTLHIWFTLLRNQSR